MSDAHGFLAIEEIAIDQPGDARPDARLGRQTDPTARADQVLDAAPADVVKLDAWGYARLAKPCVEMVTQVETKVLPREQDRLPGYN